MKKKNLQTQQDPLARNAQSISKIYHDVLLLMKFVQTKPKFKNMNILILMIYIILLLKLEMKVGI